MLKKLGQSIFSLMAGIILTGMLLDEAGKGTFGGLIQSGAKKVTSGYGSL